MAQVMLRVETHFEDVSYECLHLYRHLQKKKKGFHGCHRKFHVMNMDLFSFEVA